MIFDVELIRDCDLLEIDGGIFIPLLVGLAGSIVGGMIYQFATGVWDGYHSVQVNNMKTAIAFSSGLFFGSIIYYYLFNYGTLSRAIVVGAISAVLAFFIMRLLKVK